MGTHSVEVDAYMENVDNEAHREALAQLRVMIHEIQPDIAEKFEYKMPVFDYNGQICGMSSRKNYISLYCKPEIVDRHRDALGKLNVGKGCIRFRKLSDLPLDTVRTIITESCE
jgi:uncharacterized protein YdhG (YjbR/CyaY superfamily)